MVPLAPGDVRPAHEIAGDSRPPTEGQLSSFIPAAAVFAAGVGVLTLLGWVTGFDLLKGIAGPITAKPNTAVGLIASAISLWLIARRAPSLIGALLAAAVGVLGAATLVEHMTGVDLGIDQVLFTEPPGATATTSPGRMGPNACLSFILVAASLLLLNRRSRRSAMAAQGLAFAVAALAFIATTGYFSGAEQLFAIARYSGIALQTALAFFALSIGLLAVRTDVGPICVFVSERAGGLVLRRLVLFAVTLPIALAVISLAGQRAQLFDPALATALFAIALVVLLAAAIWWTAYVLNDVDRSRAEAQHAVTETEGRFRALANEAPVLIWVEAGGAREWFNLRWVEFTGMSVDRLRREWEALIHPDDAARYAATRQTAGQTGSVYTTEYRLKRGDGTYRWVLETAAPRRASDAAIIGFVGSCVDITERRELEQRAIAAREAAESASRMKDDFLATLSHELRTPLNAILGYARILRLDSLPESRRTRAMEVIERNALLQTQLIEDILDLSRITTGKLRLDMQPLDLVRLVHEAMDSLRPTADAKRLQLLFHSDVVSAVIRGDAARLQQIFWNVLSNALKFTEPGGRVEVTLAAQRDSVQVDVTDSGIGISSEFLPHVFEPFRQADSGLARRFGGLGLGLSVSRRLVELHAGAIAARSEGLGRGTTFSIRLPLAVETTATGQASGGAGPAAAARPAMTLAGTSVLVVDDDEEARELARDILQHAGAMVLTAADADVALEMLNSHAPHMVVTDLGMPRTDGYELLERIRASERARGTHVPVVAVTAYARSDDRVTCLRAGFVAHLPKPIDPGALIEIISGLRRHGADAGERTATAN